MPDLTYYPAMPIEWLELFVSAKRKSPNMSPTVMCCIAMAINFKFATRRNPEIKMSHDLLERFGLNRNHIIPYLESLQDAGVISFSIKNGSAPKITLLHPPTYMYLRKKKERIERTTHLHHVEQVTCTT